MACVPIVDDENSVRRRDRSKKFFFASLARAGGSSTPTCRITLALPLSHIAQFSYSLIALQKCEAPQRQNPGELGETPATQH